MQRVERVLVVRVHERVARAAGLGEQLRVRVGGAWSRGFFPLVRAGCGGGGGGGDDSSSGRHRGRRLCLGDLRRRRGLAPAGVVQRLRRGDAKDLDNI